jgi:hypothetical protein
MARDGDDLNPKVHSARPDRRGAEAGAGSPPHFWLLTPFLNPVVWEADPRIVSLNPWQT